MNTKARIEKLEAKNKATGQLLILTLAVGESAESALARWRLQTGKVEPDQVVFVQRFTC